MREEAVLLLGSNLGDRELLIKEAVHRIGKRAGKVMRESRRYESEPWGFSSPHPFLNEALVVETELPPEALLRTVLDIEAELGRQRSADPLLSPTRPQDKHDYADRPIDIDIIFYGDEIIDTPTLQVPHPRLAERLFALEPVSEVAGEKVHPLLGVTVEELLNRKK